MKKVFYFNLNNVHNAGERTLQNYNNVDWIRTKNSPEVGVHYDSVQTFHNYSMYMGTNESGKPLFDYFHKYKKFNIPEMNVLFEGINVRIKEENFFKILKSIDENVELVKQEKPDIILLRFYSYYEYFLYYFLYQIRDIKAFKAIGGADLNFNNWYYIDHLLEEGLINNFHDGYGEEHLRKIIEEPYNIPQKTENFTYIKDDYSIPDQSVHWIINTIMCNGKCRFCVHNRHARELIRSDVNFTSDEYIDFITDRLKYFELNGVKQIFVPASITFYNISHLKRFYEVYKKKNISLQFTDTYFKFEDITPETVPLLKEMGFYSIKLGLESIKYDVRLRAGKNYTNEHVYEATRLLKQYGIHFKYSFIYNFPFTDEKDLVEDLNFIKKFDLKYFSFNRFELYNETPIELDPTNNNLVKKINNFGYIYYKRQKPISPKIYRKIVNQFYDILYSKSGLKQREKYYNNYIRFQQ